MGDCCHGIDDVCVSSGCIMGIPGGEHDIYAPNSAAEDRAVDLMAALEQALNDARRERERRAAEADEGSDA